MLDYNREGPAFVPERTVKIEAYTTCAGCKYHSYRLRRSGRDPIYAHDCNHPLAEIKGGFLSGNLEPDIDDRLITPDWCPFLK